MLPVCTHRVPSTQAQYSEIQQQYYLITHYTINTVQQQKWTIKIPDAEKTNKKNASSAGREYAPRFSTYIPILHSSSYKIQPVEA